MGLGTLYRRLFKKVDLEDDIERDIKNAQAKAIKAIYNQIDEMIKYNKLDGRLKLHRADNHFVGTPSK